tara:strand:+ start:28 stop:579 length:552 start_codon:yes stop_codon:yes gene_type:complete
MKVLIILITLIIVSCTKPETVLICGDHVCINKAEAKQYFEENLTIEVKIVNRDKPKDIDLVQLNLNENQENREIFIERKNQTSKKLKTLSSDEVEQIRSEIKKKKKIKKIAKKDSKRDDTGILSVTNSSNKNDDEFKFRKKKVLKKDNIDVCLLVEKCNIEEISKYLIKGSKKKGFPNLTIRE